MKKTLSLILAGLLTVAMGTAAFAGHVAEEDRGNIKFGVKGIAETVEWTADGEWTEGEYAEIDVKKTWISTSNGDDANVDVTKNLDFTLGMSWDADYIYTYVEFVDADGHANENDADPTLIWQTGAMQINFAEVDAAGDQRLEYGIGLSSATGNFLTNVWADSIGSGYAVPEDDFIVIEDGDTMIYEFRTPVSAFSSVAAKVGAQYGVCYVISWGNTYEDYRHTQLAAGCTGDAGKAADLFAKITLEEAIVVETEPETVEVVEDAAAAAPQTFDAGIVAAVAAIVSAAGYAISKKH
ncbi:MAG: hypothetical protein IJB07_02575 [Firmicutes bacterium]|nr:hypothetical protein [Bacillota bacterium]